MDTFQKIGIEKGPGICYSGYRDGQYPGGVFPTYEQVKEDLLILQEHWKHIRLYNCDEHTDTILEVIRNERLDLRVMLGAYINGELNNFNCPWGGGIFSKPEIEQNRENNDRIIDKMIRIANEYPDVVNCLSVGNEACVEWTDHYVHESRILEFVNRVKEGAEQPVTYCENYVPWLHKLDELAAAVDFISIHSYPVWEYRHISEALEYTKHNYYSVAERFPDIPVVITEAGWATESNGRGIDPSNVNEEYQQIYFQHLTEWTENESILTYFFEAFDENWKGSPEPNEPEKHWGLYRIDRTPKMAVDKLLL